MLSLPVDIDPVNKPYNVAIRDRDPMLSMKEVEQLKKILAKKTIPNELEVYPGADHGPFWVSTLMIPCSNVAHDEGSVI
jgi:dienelactone hydrolase